MSFNSIGAKGDPSLMTASKTDGSAVSYAKGALLMGGLPPVAGPTYWVDPDNGLATNDGKSPEYPFKSVATAVTAIAAYQAENGTYVSSTYYVAPRSRVMILGGSAPCAALTALTSFTDYIGVGAPASTGDGVGIARIGTGAVAAGVALTATLRGAYFKNIQFMGGNGFDAFLMTSTHLLRCVWEECGFSDSAALTTSAMNAGLKCTGTMAQCIVRNCRLGLGHSAYGPLYGLYAGGQFSENLIENNVISGATAALYMHTSTNCTETVIRRNDIGGGACAKGIDDNSSGNALSISDNRINAVDGIEITAGGNDRFIGNIVNEGVAGSRVSLYEGVPLVRTT
jgi:hypothetical protein